MSWKGTFCKETTVSISQKLTITAHLWRNVKILITCCHLKWAMEDPETMKLVIEQGVVDSANKRALVFQAVGWSVVSWGSQAGLLQSPVQISQRVCLHPAVPCGAWQRKRKALNWTQNKINVFCFFLKQNAIDNPRGENFSQFYPLFQLVMHTSAI